MSTESNPDVVHEDHEEIGHDDYSLSRVPESARYSWVTVAVQRFGQLSALYEDLTFTPLERRFADYYRRHGVPAEKEKYLGLAPKP